MTTTTTNAESRAVENFENFDGVPADAQQVLRVRHSPHSGKELAEVVAFGTDPDLGGYWHDREQCWYLWNRDDVPPNWPTHIDAIRLAGGIIEWIRPAAVNVNPSGRAPLSWHFPN